MLVLAAIIAFGLLSRWQWARAEERRADRIELQAETAEPPVGWTTATSDPIEWRPVTLSGTYDSSATVLIRQRPLDGRNGFWVATPLRQMDGTRVWVNRGWVPVEGTATAEQPAPTPPDGDVSITGWLRVGERTPDPAPTDLPRGQASAVDPVAFDGDGAPALYVQMESSVPVDASVTPIPVPVIDEGRNVSYAIQWLLFAAVAIGGWLFFLRREAREDATRAPSERQEEASPWTST